MAVNLNNVRKSAIGSYNAIIKDLMLGLGRKLYEYEFEHLRQDLNSLRDDLAILACVYDDKDPLFKDISDEIKFVEFEETEND